MRVGRPEQRLSLFGGNIRKDLRFGSGQRLDFFRLDTVLRTERYGIAFLQSVP